MVKDKIVPLPHEALWLCLAYLFSSQQLLLLSNERFNCWILVFIQESNNNNKYLLNFLCRIIFNINIKKKNHNK